MLRFNWLLVRALLLWMLALQPMMASSCEVNELNATQPSDADLDIFSQIEQALDERQILSSLAPFNLSAAIAFVEVNIAINELVSASTPSEIASATNNAVAANTSAAVALLGGAAIAAAGPPVAVAAASGIAIGVAAIAIGVIVARAGANANK